MMIRVLASGLKADPPPIIVTLAPVLLARLKNVESRGSIK